MGLSRIFELFSTNYVVKYYLSPRCRGLIVGLQTRPPASSIILRLTPSTSSINTIVTKNLVSELPMGVSVMLFSADGEPGWCVDVTTHL